MDEQINSKKSRRSSIKAWLLPFCVFVLLLLAIIFIGGGGDFQSFKYNLF